jgi:hypothetical protein
MARNEDRPSPQPSEMARADARGWMVLSASLMRLRMAVVAVATLLSSCAEAHAGHEWPHGVESAVQTKPPTPEDTHGQIHWHGRACNELHAQRSQWLEKLPEACRPSAELLWQELDAQRELKRAAEKQLIAEFHRHPISTILW